VDDHAEVWMLLAFFDVASFLDCVTGCKARNEIGSGWDPTYPRIRFFPFWRSVLRLCPVRVYPSYAREKNMMLGHGFVSARSVSLE